MRKLAACLMLVSAATFAAGCGDTSEPGGAGATATDPDGDPVDPENTFTLTVPGTTTDVTQGKNQEVTLKIDRGDKFKDEVTLAITVPDGVKIQPEKPVIKKGESEVNVMLEVADTAAVGEHNVMVKAKPAKGKEVSKGFKVKVDKKEAAEPEDDN